MQAFAYHRPDDLDAALALLGDDEDAQVLAGGMTLLPTMKMRLAAPTALIDINGLDSLREIRERGGAIEVGALATHATVADNALLRDRIPALAALAGRIGDPQVRNRGTLGGSLANNDPAADYPAAGLGLAATVVTNRREIAADDFFVDMFETALEPGELITAVRFPVPARAAYRKFPNPASRYAIVGVMVADTADGVRVAVTGAGASVFRATAIEAALDRQLDPAVIDDIDIDSGEFNEDMHASQAWRAHLLKVMAKRAVAALRA